MVGRTLYCMSGPLDGTCHTLGADEGEAAAFTVARRRGAPADESARPQVLEQTGVYEVVGNLAVFVGWSQWYPVPDVGVSGP